MKDTHELETPLGVSVSVYVSPDDGAIVIDVGTTFEPDITDCRVWLNDNNLHWGQARKPQPVAQGTHNHCKAITCYNRLQFIDTCSRCGGETTPCRGAEDGCNA